MSEAWEQIPLEDVVDILDSKRKPISSDKRQLRVGNVPYFGANGQAGWIDDFIFDEKLVLLGEDAIDFGNPQARKAYIVAGPSWVNNHAHVLRARENIVLSEFLCHSLNSVDYSDFVAFGTRSKLTQANMKIIELNIPPLPVQRRIVDLMTHLDNHISSGISEIAALRTLQAESRRELTSQANGGTECTVGEVSSFAGGYAFSDRFQGKGQGDFPFYKVSDMNRPNSEKYMRDAANYVDSAILREMKAKAWPSGTIVFPKVGAALKTEKRRILSQQSAFDNNCMGLIPGPDVLSEFLFARMCAVRLADFAQEGAVPSVNQSHLVGIPIWLPSLAEQEAICEYLLALDYCLESLRKEAKALTQLRSSLLSELLSVSTTLPIEYDSIISEVA